MGYTRDSRGDEVNAYFVLIGDFDPNQITRRVGIVPTKTQHVGQVNPRSGRRAECARWELQPSVASPADLEDHVTAVLAALSPAFEEFRELGRKYEAMIQCVVYAYGSQAGQHFSRDHIREAALLGAAIDLDLYALHDAAGAGRDADDL
jgi:hypothetical protein